MKLKNLALLIATITLGAASSASFAAGPEQGGEIKFSGSIVEAPCSLSADSVSQTVTMDSIANSALKNGGKSTPRAFQIKLNGCDLTDVKKSVSAKFNGQPSALQPDLLALTGGVASGASLAIADNHGALIKLNTPSPAMKLINTDNTLEFQAYLQGDSDGANAVDIVPGEFTASATFTMIYQ